MLRIADLVVNEELNHRISGSTDRIEELASQIRCDGQLHPVTVRVVEGLFHLIAGSRRFAAIQMLGWSEIRALVLDVDDVGSARVRAMENLCQSNLTPVEQGLALAGWMTAEGLSIPEAAKRVYRSAGWVQSRLAVSEYPESLQQALHEGQVTLGVSEWLGRLTELSQMEHLLRYVIETGANARTVGQWVTDALARREEPDYDPAKLGQADQVYRPVVPMTTCALCGLTVRLGESSAIAMCCTCVGVFQSFKSEYCRARPGEPDGS